MNHTSFYTDLISLSFPVNELLSNENYFVDVPESWCVIVTDITNSTEAVKAGRGADINLIAAGSLIAALNVAKEFKTEIPYFFGGDGGVIIVPESLVEKVLAGLNAHRINSLKNFSLNLRIGYVSVADIIRAGHEIKIAKVLIGTEIHKSVVIGGGIKYAENFIKQQIKNEKAIKEDLDNLDLSALNLEGLECRWDKVKPPTRILEVVCLLIESVHIKDQLSVYNNVIQKLDEIYGGTEKRHPLCVKRLILINSFRKFQKEMLVRYSKWKISYLVRIFFQTLLGKIFFRFNLNLNIFKGGDYLTQLIEFSDTLTIDGRISTIISGTKENRLTFIKYLTLEEEKGLLYYGHHVSKESIMTCYIEDRQNKHIHFVDGSDGGYTEASRELKPKLRK